MYRAATLHALDRAIEDEVLPRLHDVSLLWMAPLGMVLGGIEFDGGTGYMQTWLVTSWERSTPSIDRPSQLTSSEEFGRHRDRKNSPAPYSSDAQRLAPSAEPICQQQESSSAESASPSNAAVGED